MDVSPRVSVLMPIYNTKPAYLQEAIESILSQTYTNFELIILNDSPQDTLLEKIVASYTDNRIKYFANNTTLGITPSRNKLIEMAKGEYLAVMDHDDISLPTRFEKQVAYLDKHPHIGVVSCQMELFPSNNKVTQYPAEDKEIKLLLLSSCPIVHPASMLRASVLLSTGLRYEEEFSPAEDYALWCRLIPHTSFHNIQDVLFKYRWHEANTTKLCTEKIMQCTIAVQAFAVVDNPVLYRESIMRSSYTLRLFGCIPILTIFYKGNSRKYYLFGCIPILTCKKTMI